MTNDKKKNATIVDIAKIANVTNITVSRAFTKPEMVKEETRKKIYEIAKQLNYSPNAFARNLKVSQSNIIGVVTDSTYNQVYAEVVKMLCLEADKRGFTVMMFETNGSVEAEERAVDVLLSYKASGIVLSVITDNEAYSPAYIKKIKATNTPLVLLDRDLKQFDLPGVFLNNLELGIKAGRYLLSKDYNSILIFGGPEDSVITQDRISGIKRLVTPDKTLIDICYTQYGYDKARPLILKKLEKITHTTLPECIVGINGPVSLAAIGACRTLGIHKGMQFFSFDEVPFSVDFGIKIPCIYNNPKEWGQKISSLLFSLIENHNSLLYFDRSYINGNLRL
ncbi:MAG: LacI family DNA-binding transcriptional regulator [Succinivibrio sp.]|nr:LacI family DNA-binding transcriptional regulator [Succinivibrio sp.]